MKPNGIKSYPAFYYSELKLFIRLNFNNYHHQGVKHRPDSQIIVKKICTKIIVAAQTNIF